MRRWLIAIILVAASTTGAAQATDNTIYAKNFPGGTVYQKVFAAKGACPTPTLVPCIIVVDPSLAAFPTGPTPLPVMETNQFLLDYRQGPPAESGLVGVLSVSSGYVNSTLPLQVGTSVFATGQGVLRRAGTVLWPPTNIGSSAAAEFTMLPSGPEGNCSVVTATKCWKFLLTLGTGGTFYGESADGINDFRLYSVSGVPTPVFPSCYHSSWLNDPASGKYIAFCGNGTSNFEYTSTSAGSLGVASSWSAVGAVTPYGLNTNEVIVGSTMYLSVETGGAGLVYTSPSPYTTFTFLNNATPSGIYYGAPSQPFLANGTWWQWWTIPYNGPNQHYNSVTIRMTSPNVNGPYTFAALECYSETIAEGANLAFSQCVDPDPVVDNTNPQNQKFRFYYTAGSTDTFGTIELAIADMPLSSFVETQGGFDDGSLAPIGPFGWIYSGTANPKNVNIEGLALTNVGAYSGTTASFSGTATIGGLLTVAEVITANANALELAAPSSQPLVLSSNNQGAGSHSIFFDSSYHFRPNSDGGASNGEPGNAWSFTTSQSYLTDFNCESSASPAVCGSANAGRVAVAAGSTTLVVDTTIVTANSEIQLTFDSSLGTALGVTCNTTPVQAFVSGRSGGNSFTITVAAAPSGNPACFAYTIMN